MYFRSVMSREWKSTVKIVIGIFNLLAIVLVLPMPADASQTALVRASDGNVYQIRFPNEDLSGRYSISNFIDNFSIYNETGQVELCPGNDQSVTRELYTAARVLAQTPRNTPLFDTSPLVDTLIQTAEDLGIDQEGNVDVVGIVGDIVKEMAVDELQGQIQTVVDPSLNLGIVTINLNTFKIKINASGPDIIVKPTEFLSRLVGLEIELRWMLYAFSRASIYANTTIHLQALANQRAAALWDAINAGEVVDIAGHAFTIHEDAIEISNAIGVFDPFRLRLAAGVYRAYAEYVAELGTNLAEHEGPVATLANRISVDIITEFLFTLSDAQSAIAEKDALDELDARIPGDINTRLHANINGIYDSAASDLNQHGFCAPDLRFTAVPPTVPEGDTLTYTVALNSAPGFLAIISISSDNPDVTVSPTSLTFTSSNWYIPKRVGVDVSADADSIDESVSLSHVVAGYAGGMVREFQFDITDQVSNRAPEAIRTIPDQTLTVGDSSAPLDLPTHFHDPDADLLTYTVVSSNPNVATTQRVGSQLTIWTLNVGNTTVTVRATDADGLFITQTFSVTVDPAAVQQRPEQVGTISTQYMTLSGGDRTVDVASYFSSPNTLSYTVSSSPFGFVEASISGSQVTITSLQAGSASVFVTARDSQNPDLSAIQTIPVSVSHAIIVRPPTPTPFTPPTTNPDVEGLREGVSVITQLSPGFVLNVREHPGTDEEIMEQLGSDVIGTITDGPERADGFRWWEIEWDIRGLDLKGWSAESDRGQILFRRPPDLEIQDLDVTEDEVKPGDRFTVEVRVLNNGPGESVPTEVAVYYSLERHSNRAEFDADRNKSEVGTISIPSLRAGRRTERSLRVEAPGTPDRYYYGALLPSNIHPTDYTRDLPSDARENDLASQERVTVTTAPDLIVASISSDTSVLDPGEAFSLEVTVRNQGVGEPENNTTLHYYRSSNAAISSNDTEVGTDSVYRGNLDTNETDRISASITAPSEPGVYYYGACVDDVEHESNTRNNCSSAIAITVREPSPEPTPDFSDLVPSTPTVSANALAPGESFTLETTIENRGTGGSQDTTLRWYRSADPNISSNDTEVGNSRVSSLASGETAPHQLDLNAPAAAGTYYYGIGVESVANESNTANNYSTAITLTVENLAPVVSKTLPAQTLVVGNLTVVDVAPYFSDPNQDVLTYTASSEAPELLVVEMAGLSDSRLNINPLATGDVTITVEVSDGEFTATQTLSVSVTGTSSPDLIVKSISLIGEATLAPGDNFRLNTTVQNQGIGESDSTALRYYRSSDSTISGSDAEVGTDSVSALNADGTETGNISLIAPLAAGTYYYGVCVDSVADESDTNNNCSQSVTITVQQPAQTQTADAIYWTDWDSNKIQRASPNGSNVQDLVTTGLVTPYGIALDVTGGKMYWADAGTAKIQRANLDGSHIQNLIPLGLGIPICIALDVAGGKMYWTDRGTGKIQRANLDGANVENLVFGVRGLHGIALDVGGGKMYWTDNDAGKIQRANLNGTSLEDLITTGLQLPNEIALDVGGGKMYWADDGTQKIQRANLNGTGVEDLVTTGLNVPVGITLDIVSGKMYWTDLGTRKIQRANLDGANVEDLVTTGLNAPFGIALGTSLTISPPVVAREDVNSDGVVDAQDVVLVDQNNLDLNDDGVSDIADVLLVVEAMGNAAGAPAARLQAQHLLTAERVQLWLVEAKLLDEDSPAYRRGILVLEQLLALLAPRETVLLPNYPNPFNPETWIPYQIAEPADVTFHIYATTGHLVRTLRLGHQQAGIYHNRNRAAYWDGRNELGEPVASGLYFYTLSAGRFTATRKMLIRK